MTETLNLQKISAEARHTGIKESPYLKSHEYTRSARMENNRQ